MVEKPRVTLNDGTIFEDSQCGYAEHTLWLWLKGITFAQAFAAFSDPEKTKTILFQYGNQEETYTGFTEINLIQKSESTIDVRMIKPE